MTEHESLTWGAVILAAGKGTRMRSDLPKVLHEAAGRTLLDHVLDLALTVVAPGEVTIVVGHGADQVRARVAGRGVRTVLQEPQLGTGDAVRVAVEALPRPAPEALLVLSGDVPLLRPQTIERLRAEIDGCVAVLLTAELSEPGSYGRVLRREDGTVKAVVEAGDADARTLAVGEVNAGVYAFRRQSLEAALAGLSPGNVQGEYYLTDVAAALAEKGLRVAAVRLEDPTEMMGVNTVEDLRTVETLLAGGRRC
jgi:UDP-N-acetylglucosamine diphosphorylase/glucosamine-1-phosphate N-acetyltransferase